MKCPTCKVGNITIERVVRACDPLLPAIIVDGFEHGVCAHCGEVITGVPRSLELGAIVLGTIVSKFGPLTGDEIRHLRKSLGLKAAELGLRLAVNEQQVSRWENGKRPMAAAADRLLRMLIAVQYGLPAPELASIDHTAAATPVALHVELTRKGWRVVDQAAKAA